MPYMNYVETATSYLVLLSPLIVLCTLIRARNLRLAGRAYPFSLAVLEAALAALIIAVLVVTVVATDQSGRSFDANPLTGVTGTDAFRWLFAVNFVILPMPLAAVAVTRFNQLTSIRASLPIFSTAFILVEVAQYVRGGRAASIQDVLLAVAGAILASTFLGRLVGPISRELLRTRDTEPAGGRLRGHVSPRRTIATALAVICPFAWTATLDAPSPSPTASFLPGEPSTCGLDPGDWTIPSSAPSTEWVEWHEQLLPRSETTFGPVRTNAHGGHCFARNPSGALFAAAWSLGSVGTGPHPLLAGFRVDAADPGRVKLALLLRTPRQYVIVPAQARWVAGDWSVTVGAPRMRAATAGPPLGYVKWSPAGLARG